MMSERTKRARDFMARFVDYASAEKERQEIGSLGEAFVLNLEVEERMSKINKELVEYVEHTSQKRGDGARI